MSNYPTVAWSELSPAGSDQINAGDNAIRLAKTQIREVIDVDHDFPSSGQAADVGQHKKVTLQEQADLGTGAVGATILGSQTVSGKGELVYTDEDDNDIQMSSGGKMGAATTSILANNVTASGDVDVDGTLISDDIKIDTNNTYIKSKNAAGSGTVNLIKANASDKPVLPDGAEMATSGAPTTDAGIANKKYVDDKQVISASLLSANGYVKIGSLYIQWGSVDPGGSYTASVSFPITFPNAVYQVVVGGSNSTGGGRINCYATSITTSGFTAGIEPGEGPARWIAIGI